MLLHQLFFQKTDKALNSSKADQKPLTIVNEADKNATEGFLFFHGLDSIFIIDGNYCLVELQVLMEPLFVEGGQKKDVVDIIRLHQGEQIVQLYSKDKVVLTQLYKLLKKRLAHKGFNQFFKPLKRLGRGSFAAVYLLESKATGDKMAAKVFSKQGHKLGYKGKESLEKEIDYLKGLEHPNIIRFDGIYRTDNLIYVVTEYLSGGTLSEFRRQNSLCMEDHILKIMTDILKGLSYLKEKNIMHRDIKPENIVLRKEDGRWVLVDFGIAANCDEKLLYSQCGTRGYMAPEVLDENQPPKPYNEACDMYSFGVICYEMILGHLPFKVEMENMHDVKIKWEGLTKKDCAELNPEIVKIIRGLLEADPAVRWTPKQCLESELVSSPQVMEAWKNYKEKKRSESYDKILTVRPKN